jgi:hypothetical protein
MDPDIHFGISVAGCNFLREMATRIEQSHGGTADWRVLFVDGLRGFAARVMTVFHGLARLDEPFQVPATKLNPEQWAVDTDRLVGEIFFGMDSAIECFVFAMNAAGYIRDRAQFCDIATAQGLKRIRPDNIYCDHPADKKNPLPGYATFFPRVVAHWRRHQNLVAEIMEYHDVSKHRSCIIAGSGPAQHGLPVQPKLPGSLYRTPIRTVENVAKEFHEFCEALMIEVTQDLAAAFGIQLERNSPPG